jgi:hypothetical protein
MVIVKDAVSMIAHVVVDTRKNSFILNECKLN